MITTKYNFKLWLHKAYPDIIATPIYGIPAYILSKSLNTVDNYKYSVQQLDSGRYIVFIGTTPEVAKEMLKELKANGIPSALKGRYKESAPTTFSSFELWLNRNNITYKNRTFCSHTTAAELFQDENMSMERKTYYMYELPIDCVTNPETVFINSPYKIMDNTDGEKTLIVLIKASNSTYKSKKQLFMEKFHLMQPLYEKLIAYCAKAGAMDDIQPGSGVQEWEQAKLTCEQYMGIQFEVTGIVNLDKLKEAANDGTLGFFVRERGNIESVEEDGF